MSESCKKNRRAMPMHKRYVVEDEPFETMRAILILAKQKGFDGGIEAVRSRYFKGARTWAELSAPINRAKKTMADMAVKSCKSRRDKEREECAAALAAIDARKREMGQ